MTAMSTPFPHFARPPLDEVVIGVQYDPLPGFHAGHLGLFWLCVRSRYPLTEDQASLVSVKEKPTLEPGDVIPVQLPLIPRCWFLTRTKERLVQLQAEKFIRNWRKVTGDEVYPRYSTLIGEFAEEWQEFQTFVRVESLGNVKVNQCELSYIDHLEVGGSIQMGDLSNVISVLRSHRADSAFLRPEVVTWGAQYLLPDGLGRLSVQMNPAFRGRDMKLVLALTLTARGAPAESGGALKWFDMAHEWVNRAFAELTDPQMHERWGKIS